MGDQNKYIGLTIGPVVETLTDTRATRELWAASYTLSYIMREIARAIKADKTRVFIVPSVEDELLFAEAKDRPRNYLLGAGVFPDRMLFKAGGNDGLEVIQGIVDGVLDRLGDQIAEHLSLQAIRDAVVAYLKSYFQIDIVIADLGPKPSPIQSMSTYLNACEMRRQFPLEKKAFLRNFFSWVTKSFLVKEAFGEPSHGFETLLGIATREFEGTPEYQQALSRPSAFDGKAGLLSSWHESDERAVSNSLSLEDAKSDLDLLAALAEKYKGKKDGLTFKPVHKYVAIVYSDGDRVGKIIEAIEQQEKQEHGTFSKALGAFAIQSVQKVKDYGGMPIYAGGDDLLFFAPVVTGSSNIFRFLRELDQSFRDAMGETGREMDVSLSFGLSISYYKFPLAEALESARDLLYEEAKGGAVRRNIAFKIQKHSGASFGSIIHIPAASAQLFDEMLATALGSNADELLRSLIYTLRESEQLIAQIAKDESQIKQYLRNSFNEAIHQAEPFKSFIDGVGDLIHLVFKEWTGNKADVKTALDRAHSLLRTLAFLTQREERS